MLKGNITLKGDKSISHRILIFAALSEGECTINNLSTCKDVQRTVNILKQCNIMINNSGNGETAIKGSKLSSNSKKFNCGNSGSTARFMLGLLPSHGISGTLYGDESLSLRPMERVINPLSKMNIKINHNNGMLPIEFKASESQAINHALEVPSAQVKTSMILAALSCNKKSYITDSFVSRDHTERILQYLGHKDSAYYKFKIPTFNYTVPGDISNAAFIISAALLMPESNITIKNTLYNKTRTGYIQTLKQMGGKIKVYNQRELYNEMVVDINVQYTPKLKGITITEKMIVSMIDEVPILALVASFATGETIVEGAQELRYKESDRINAIVTNLKACKANIKETKDGFIIKGPNILYNTSINTFKDHRIAMTFEILSLILGEGLNEDVEKTTISTSFPEFYKTIRGIHE